MKYRTYSLFFTIIVLAAASCKDIFERDLAKTQVTLLAPINNYTTDIMTQQFWWEEVEGAASYRLQIITPSFSSMQRFVVDTTLTDNLFNFTLEPGEYQWRVRAENESSNTPYNTYTLTIDTTSDLGKQTIMLQSPASETYSGNLNQSFNWQGLFSASSYNVQIAKQDFSSTSNILLDTTVTTNGMIYSFKSEDEYQWRVRALNNNSSSSFSAPFTLVIDTTSPAAPSLLVPTYGATVTTQPFSYNWSRDIAAQTSPIAGDSLYVYTDSLATLAGDVFFTTSTSVSDSLASGTYFWRVRTIDQAGNISPFSSTGKFTVQ